MNARHADRSARPAVSVWLAGTIGLDAYGAMAERLAWEVSEPDGRPPTLVLYDPAPSITIGRLGSRADIGLSDDDLRSRGLDVRFIGRGGGAVLHGPGTPRMPPPRPQALKPSSLVLASTASMHRSSH